jgi:uncharacterized phage protein (TIGR02220 family)
MARKSLPWLRLYTEFSTDYKVQMLPEAMQRRLIMLFCFQREGTLNSMSDDEICYRLGISKNEWKNTRLKFYQAGFINDDASIKNGDDFLKNFALRQKDSDDSAKRQRDYRSRAVSHNHVTTMSRDMSQLCLNIDIDTYTQDTDKEEEKDKNIKALSGRPDIVPLKSQNFELKKQAIEILNFLNSKTGRVFRPVDTNLKLIIARLKSGATMSNCRQVIAKKTREWKDNEKMVEYLRPATLFNATKFEQYVGELVPVEEN